MLKKVSKKHNDWIKIAQTYLSKEDAEDIVQELYITLHDYNIKESKILWNGEINRGFIYIVLTNLCKNHTQYYNRQKRDTRLNISLDERRSRAHKFVYKDHQDQDIEHMFKNPRSLIGHQDEDQDCIFERIQTEVDTWSNYDSKLFELYMYSGLSLRELSKGSKKEIDKFINKNFKLHPEATKRGTAISVTSMFHTIKQCKEKLKLKLNYEI